MAEFVKALSGFLARDVIFAFGGSCVLISAMLLVGIPLDILKQIAGVYWVVWFGLAYVTAYVTQEIGTLICIITTANWFEPCRPLLWLYRHHRRYPADWQPPDRFEPEKVLAKLDTRNIPAAAARLERLITLKQLGNSIGCCLLVSAILLGIHACMVDRGTTPNDWGLFTKLSACAFVLAFVLIWLGWLKAVHQMDYMAELADQIK